jgi:putative nucleotidyltransferase with HDIG domain
MLPEDTATISALLTKLATGAGQHLFTVNSWASQLNGTADTLTFLEQLRKEWQPITIPSSLSQEMMDICREYLSGYVGWPHLWAHTLRVTGNALGLAQEAGIEQEHAFLMGIFHDIGKLEEMNGGDSHETAGADIFRTMLSGRMPDKLITLMANVIAKSASPINPYTQVLYDADKLDKIGATGIARRISTDWGAQHIRYALGRVRDDALDFPAMHFLASRKLAKLKLAYTKKFVESIGAIHL